MIVIHIYEDGSRKETGMGCFGSCGRADSNGARPPFGKEAREFSTRRELGFSGNGDYWGGKGATMYSKPVRYLALADGFEQLFHVNNKQIMQYLIESSPYKICFDQTYDEVYQQNEVRVLATGIPSEVTMSCLFMLRRIAQSFSMNITFNTLTQHCHPWMALITARLFPTLGVGSLSHEFNSGGDGTFFPSYFSTDLVKTEDPFAKMDLFQRSVNDLGGYIMNIREMWNADKPKVGVGHINKIQQQYSAVVTVQGLFGAFQTRQVTDIPAFLKDLWG